MVNLTAKWAGRLVVYGIILIVFGIVMYLREAALLFGSFISTASVCGGSVPMIACILEYQGVMRGLFVYGGLFAVIGASMLSFPRLWRRKNGLFSFLESDSFHARICDVCPD